MKSIKNSVVNEIVIEKSRFITYLFNSTTTKDSMDRISEIKRLHPDSTHIVYGLLNSKDERSNDNGEPKGTAGIPTIEVLRKNNLTNIIAITVRYFGGIKLGAGGLVRAYTKGVTEALKKAEFSELQAVLNVELILTYKDSSFLDKVFDYYLNIDKNYQDKVQYNIQILKSKIDSFKKLFLNFKDEYSFNIISEVEVFI